MPDGSRAEEKPGPAGDGGGKNRFAWFRPLRKHAIFPILVFIVASEIIRENYPFSHFPMYSRPTSGQLTYYYVADGEGTPLPLMWHTGITPARTSKMLASQKEIMEKGDGPPRTEAQLRAEAAAEVLRYLRHMNSKRETRPLPEKIQLFAVTVGYGDGEFTETPEVIAENP